MALTPKSALAKDQRTGKAEMQHRHFATVAAILAGLDKDALGLSDGQHLNLCQDFADELAGTNHNFDRDRFLAACGVQEVADA